MTDETDRAVAARNAADAALGDAGRAKVAAEDALRQAEAGVTQAAGIYAGLLARAVEDEPIGTEELADAKAAEQQAQMALDLAHAKVAAATKRWQGRYIDHLVASQRVVQTEMQAAVAARIEAAKAVQDKVSEAEAALASYHQAARRIESARFAAAEHDRLVMHGATVNAELAAMHSSERPKSRVQQADATLGKLSLALVQDTIHTRAALLQLGRARLNVANLADAEAAGWWALRLPTPAPLPEPEVVA